MLIEAGHNEVEFFDLTGHSKSFLERTEAGRIYTNAAKVAKLNEMIQNLPSILVSTRHNQAQGY